MSSTTGETLIVDFRNVYTYPLPPPLYMSIRIISTNDNFIFILDEPRVDSRYCRLDRMKDSL